MTNYLKIAAAAFVLLATGGTALADSEDAGQPATIVVSASPVHYPAGVDPTLSAAGDQGGP